MTHGVEGLGSLDSNLHYYLQIVPPTLVEAVRKRYAQPHRKYHTWQHVCELFDHLQLVDERVACLPAVVLAVLYHDVVYDPRRKDNELRSAVALRRATGRLEPYWVERAESMILATQHHVLPPGADRNSDEAYFLDIDMAILAAPAARYAEYAQQVRQEYRHLPDAKYRAGRAAVLRGFLARASLFQTEWGQVMYERKARANIAAELEQLAGE